MRSATKGELVAEGKAEHDGWLDLTLERVIPDPSNPPEGLIAHFGGPSQTGGWKVTDIWESEAHWERFRDETLIPVAKEIQAPPFDSDIGDLHNRIVTERVAA